MRPLVIYHRADFDGLFCREIARRHFEDEAEYQGWDYGDPEPVVPAERELFILDLSVPGLMAHPRLVWIDHHKTAIERFPTTISGYRIDGVAACRLAWQWFDNEFSPLWQPRWPLPGKQDFIDRKVQEPYAVRLAGEYDIWDKRDPNTDRFQHGLRSRDLAACWPLLLSMRSADAIIVDELLQAGKALEFSRERENESIIKAQGFTVHFEGRTFLALNTARCNSLTFTAGLTPDHEGCLAFNWTGRDWRVSLYGAPSRPDLDLSAIAQKFGGGGHRQACGFRTAVLPFVTNGGAS